MFQVENTSFVLGTLPECDAIHQAAVILVSCVFLLGQLACLFVFLSLLPVINLIWLRPQIKTSRCMQSVFHSDWTVIVFTVEGEGARRREAIFYF